MSEADSLISVVVPAFREADNLVPLVERTFAALNAAALQAEMIIVNDESGDTTADVVAGLSDRFPVRILNRTADRGLASAVIDGFRIARGEILAVMDADLQHPPEALPDLVSALRSGAEFAIGSRYVQGASTDPRWHKNRRWISRIATLPARPLARVSDPMSGFFALRREVWTRAASLKPTGYKIALELLVRARCRDVAEVPITFGIRRAGDSKLTAGVQLRYACQLLRLYVHRFGAWLAVLGVGAAVTWLLLSGS